MVAQSFLYTSVFFSFGLILAHFLQCAERTCRLLRPAACDRQFLRTAAPQHPVRYSRPSKNDLDELLELSDRLVVMFHGQFVYEARGSEADLTEIGRHMAGH
jgi:hypothetical protein